jgi:hypothetical protein
MCAVKLVRAVVATGPTTAAAAQARPRAQPEQAHEEDDDRRADPHRVVGQQVHPVPDLVDAQDLVVDHAVEELEGAHTRCHRRGPPAPRHLSPTSDVRQQEQRPDRDEPAEGVEDAVGRQRDLRRRQVVEVVPLQTQVEDEQVDHRRRDPAAEQEAGQDGPAVGVDRSGGGHGRPLRWTASRTTRR